MSRGYVYCACRDCFESAIAGDDDTKPTLCHECESAGCDADGDSECCNPGYGENDEL